MNLEMDKTCTQSSLVAGNAGGVQRSAKYRGGAKHGNADSLSRCTNCSQRACIENQDGWSTREELAGNHFQVTVISLAPLVSMAKLEQIQQTPGSPIIVVREILLTGVAPDSLVLETSGP